MEQVRQINTISKNRSWTLNISFMVAGKDLLTYYSVMVESVLVWSKNLQTEEMFETNL